MVDVKPGAAARRLRFGRRDARRRAVMVYCRKAIGFDVLAAMDTPPVGLIGLQQVGTHRSRRCFGKTPMQTLRSVAHVAYEKSLREHASVGSHG